MVGSFIENRSGFRQVCGWLRVAKVLLFQAVLPCLTVSSQAGDEVVGPLLSTNCPFALYLQNPPWMQDVVFRRNQVYETSRSGHIDSTKEVIEEYKGALQPAGFYLQHIFSYSQIANNQVSRLTRSLLGASGEYYWTAYWDGEGVFDERSLVLDPRDPSKGGSDNNATRGLLEVYRRYLESIRYFGFAPLQPGSFVLAPDNLFKATRADGTQLSGKILKASGNAPQSLTYQTGDGGEALIDYDYGTNKDLPNYFVVTEKMNGRLTGISRTNWIDHVRYGLDGLRVTGYMPLMFFKNLSGFNHIVVWSNEVSYTLGMKGQLSADEKFQALPAIPGVTVGRATEARMVMVAIIFASLVIAWASMQWARKQKKQ
jgi:hypothetical protein